MAKYTVTIINIYEISETLSLSLNPFSLPPSLSQGIGDLRLVHEGKANASYEGRIEVYYDNSWVAINDKQWSKDDAIVACRQLGYETGKISKKDIRKCVTMFYICSSNCHSWWVLWSWEWKYWDY